MMKAMMDIVHIYLSLFGSRLSHLFVVCDYEGFFVFELFIAIYRIWIYVC